jgi:hypothetical protein
MSLGRALSRSVGAALAAATAMAAVPVPAAAAPAYTLQERAQAIAKPAVVFLETRVSGIVRNKASGTALSDKQVTVFIRCSGFVVNPDGIAVTLQSCVSPTQQQADAWAFEAYANQLVDEKKIGENQRDGKIAQLRQTASFTGDSADQPPVSTSFAQMNVATPGATAAPAWPAELQTPVNNTTDLAVMKIAQSNLPAVEVNGSADVGTVQTPVALGYVAVDNKTLTVQSRPVNVSGPYEKGDDQVSHKLDAALGWESRGGLVADLDGRAIGLTTPDLQGQIDVVKDASAISAELTAHGLKSQLSKTDLRYRQALDLYYGGKYREAIQAFDQVIAQSPANQTAADFRKQAQDRQDIEGGSSGVPLWLIILLSVIATAIILGGAAVFILRQRRGAGRHPDSINSVSVNPFASPVSGAGYPVSGGGYATWSRPVSGPPPAAEMQAAPPDMPVPHPPVQHPPANREIPQPEVVQPEPLMYQEPAPATGESVHTPPVAPEMQTVPAPPPPPPPTTPAPRQFPEFAWPEDDAPDSPSEINPWAPPPRN